MFRIVFGCFSAGSPQTNKYPPNTSSFWLFDSRGFPQQGTCRNIRSEFAILHFMSFCICVSDFLHLCFLCFPGVPKFAGPRGRSIHSTQDTVPYSAVHVRAVQHSACTVQYNMAFIAYSTHSYRAERRSYTTVQRSYSTLRRSYNAVHRSHSTTQRLYSTVQRSSSYSVRTVQHSDRAAQHSARAAQHSVCRHNVALNSGGPPTNPSKTVVQNAPFRGVGLLRISCFCHSGLGGCSHSGGICNLSLRLSEAWQVANPGQVVFFEMPLPSRRSALAKFPKFRGCRMSGAEDARECQIASARTAVWTNYRPNPYPTSELVEPCLGEFSKRPMLRRHAPSPVKCTQSMEVILLAFPRTTPVPGFFPPPQPRA